LRPFNLHEPSSVQDAVSLLSTHGDDAKVYAGGTELLLAMKAGLLSYAHLVNVKTVAGLSDIAYDSAAGVLSIGSTATHRSLELSPLLHERYPLLADVERRVANIRVRNVGTLGGNLCFAEPHSDPGVALLLYDATVESVAESGTRSFSLEELQLGSYETGLAENELLARILVPQFPKGMHGAYLKFGYHHRPTLGMGVALKVSGGIISDIRIAFGSVSPKPLRVREAEELMRGAVVADVLSDVPDQPTLLVAEAGQLAAKAAEPVDDMHGSAEYKEHLVKLFLARALAEAIQAAGGA
jgi:aerobic carbon-monoxide dehydrogenase medium subunit